MVPQTTLLYGAALGLLFAVLSANVSRIRFQTRNRGDPTTHRDLYRAVRAHGNLAESAALALVLLLLCELSGAPRWALHALGGGYLTARLLHAGGTLFKQWRVHILGAGLSVVILGTGAAGLLWLRVH